MKKTMLAAILLTFCFSLAQAADVEIQIGKSIYAQGAVKPANNLKLIVAHKGFYIAGESESFMIYGQNMAINSLSLGYRHKFGTTPFFVFGQAGYYCPDYDSLKFGWEAIYIEQSKHYGYNGLYIQPISDHYRLDFRPGFGAEIGGGVRHNFSKTVSVSLSVSYRYLRLWADYDGLDAAGAQYWIMSRSDNFDAVKVFGGLNIEF